MGGVDITVATKDKPEQSLFDSYLLLHPDMFLKGRLGEKDASKKSWEPDVEMRRKEAPDEKYPIEIFRPGMVSGSEDVPPEILALIPLPFWLTNIGCELSSKQNWMDAEELAIYIARKCRGVVYTSEVGIMWHE